MIHIKPQHLTQAARQAGVACALALTLAVAPAVLPAPAQAQSANEPQKLPAVTLGAGMHLIQAMVARSPDERATGLMFRKEMGTNEGMLFVFEQPATQCFWMKNTLLPLSAAFVKDDGSIVNIEDMKPQTTDGHCSKEPVRYVLEMHQGWFAKRGFKAGSKLTGEAFRR